MIRQHELAIFSIMFPLLRFIIHIRHY